MSLSVLILEGDQAEGHAVVREAGSPSPLLDTLKGATSLSSCQGSEFYYLTEPASVLHCANSGLWQPSDNNHLTKPSGEKKNRRVSPWLHYVPYIQVQLISH